VLLHLGRGADRAGEDPVGEAGGEPLDLGLDARRHVDRRARRHVAVGPERRPPGRRPAVVDDRRLDDEAEGGLGVAAGVHLGLGPPDLGQRAADVDGAGDGGGLGGPGHRPVEGPVDLADPGPVAEAPVGAAGPGVQAVAGQVDELARRHVEEDEARGRELGQAADAGPGRELAAPVSDLVDEGVDEDLAAAADHGPAHRVGAQGEDEAEAAGEGGVQRPHAVGGHPGHDRSPLVGAEAAGQPGGGLEPEGAEAGQEEG